jgi:hypothetical protein
MMSAAPRKGATFRAPEFAQAASMPSEATAQAASSATAPASGATPAAATVFVEKNGYVSMAAEHPTRTAARGGATWKVIPGLGRLGDSMAVFPTTTHSINDLATLASTSPEMEYDFVASSTTAAAKVAIYAIPTHRINPQRHLRYAVAIDSETPQAVDLETPENNATWSENVLRAAAIGATSHNVSAGHHTLHLYMVDPGVVIDHLTIDLGGLPKSYLPPAETGGGR